MRTREEILTASHTKEKNSFPKFYYVKQGIKEGIPTRDTGYTKR